MIYFVILAIILGAAIGIKPEQQKDRKDLLIAIVTFVCLVCGLRDMLGGYDNYLYGEIFDATAMDLRMGYPISQVAALNWEHSEKLYAVWTIFVAFVASDVNGLKEVTEGYGILFPHGDADALANIILQLSEDKAYYQEVANRCYERARQFDIGKMVEAYNEIYEGLR